MGKKIMIVDDSASVRQMVSFTLAQAGYDVYEAEDGKDALEKFDGNSTNLMITDIYMPHMDGIELIREVRANPHNKFVPIIVLTTESQIKRKNEAKSAGATGWIVKPFRPEQLVMVVRKVLG